MTLLRRLAAASSRPGDLRSATRRGPLGAATGMASMLHSGDPLRAGRVGTSDLAAQRAQAFARDSASAGIGALSTGPGSTGAGVMALRARRPAHAADGGEPDPRASRGADAGFDRQARSHGDRRRRQPVRPDPLRLEGAAADGARDRAAAAAGAARRAQRRAASSRRGATRCAASSTGSLRSPARSTTSTTAPAPSFSARSASSSTTSCKATSTRSTSMRPR